jgi:hypothetical protein
LKANISFFLTTREITGVAALLFFSFWYPFDVVATHPHNLCTVGTKMFAIVAALLFTHRLSPNGVVIDFSNDQPYSSILLRTDEV